MIGKMLGGRYEILEKIGEGGMGLVYKAKCHLLNRNVAVKILKPELTCDEEFITKFKKESLSAASLSHSNIVNIYDVGCENDIYYIVMEYINGKTLKQIIKEEAPLSFNRVINISKQICFALEHAHINKIIHRDIKPQNILITNDGIVKVTDFGIARTSNSTTITNTGNMLGSAYYISPEQARGVYTDEKTDIYSLGIVMYEMATGKVPFVAESPVVVALKHIQDNITRPSNIIPDIKVALEDIILKCLEKSSSLRYKSAAMVVKDLEVALLKPNEHIISEKYSSNDFTKIIPVIDEKLIKTDEKNKKAARQNKKINKILIVTIIIIVTSFTLGALIIIPKLTKQKPSDVVIPNIIGYDKEIAERMLKDLGLKMQIIDNIEDDKNPIGVVLSTSPDVGVSVKQDWIIKVKISAGPHKIILPSFVGKSLDDVKLEIERLGLKMGNITYINDEKVEKDKIIKQSPEGGKTVYKDEKVDIYISKGPEVKTAIVPLIEGINFDNTKINLLLEKENLKLGKVDYIADNTRPNNVILKQSIPNKTEVKEGTIIDITVNKLPITINTTP